MVQPVAAPLFVTLGEDSEHPPMILRPCDRPRRGGSGRSLSQIPLSLPRSIEGIPIHLRSTGKLRRMGMHRRIKNDEMRVLMLRVWLSAIEEVNGQIEKRGSLNQQMVSSR